MSAFSRSSTSIQTIYGPFLLSCFSFGPHEEDNLLCLQSASAEVAGATDVPPLCRVQSACYTAEIFRSLDCDCHEQLDESLRLISREGGALIYMLCDGRGAGLLQKVRGLELNRVEGLDTSDAYRKLGLAQDPREYDRVAAVLKQLGLFSVRLLTNNPRKVEGLRAHGIVASRVPLEIVATEYSRSYLRTKASKMGHLLTQFVGGEGQ